MKCPQYGHDNTSDAQFCGGCGTSLSVSKRGNLFQDKEAAECIPSADFHTLLDLKHMHTVGRTDLIFPIV